MVWNVQSFRPVRTSNAWTSPGGTSRVRGSPIRPRPPSEIELPTTTTSPATSGCRADQFVLRTMCRMPAARSARPLSPNAGSGRPVRASIDRRYASWVPTSRRSASPSVQYPMPRVRKPPLFGRPTAWLCGSYVQRVSPVAGSSAMTMPRPVTW